MAGVQIRRDFSTRPDLITMPSPRLSASAAAPSILDLYVNDVPVLSRRVGAGPIEIDGLPPTRGFSEARLVLRDEAGRQTTVTAPFFTTPLLLRRGFVDYAAEAGFARRYFGVRSNDYADMLLATGSVRYGLRDSLTLEGHAEGGAGLVNLGGGVASSWAVWASRPVSTSAAEQDHRGRPDRGRLRQPLRRRLHLGDGHAGLVRLSRHRRRHLRIRAWRDVLVGDTAVARDANNSPCPPPST
jgi:outer membrane usher protein